MSKECETMSSLTAFELNALTGYESGCRWK